MQFDQPLSSARLLKRYKRFLADVILDDGKRVTLHCPNTGSMKGCQQPHCRVWFSTVNHSKRKYPNTWEIIEVDHGCLVGINTHRANGLVAEAIHNGIIKELQGYESIRREVKYGEQNSRIDFLLESDKEQCFVEVKNVTLGENGYGYFPDAVTARGAKHLQELISVKAKGKRAVICYCVQHTGIREVYPAFHIDPVYSNLLREALKQGVEVIAYGAAISPEAITLTHAVPVRVEKALA